MTVGGWLLLGALAFGAGEAQAQCVNRDYDTVVPGTPELPILSPYDEISCRYGREDRRNRAIFLNNPRISVVDDFVPGIEASHEGIGHLSVYVFATEDLATEERGFGIPSPADYSQGISTRGDPDLYLTGDDSYGVHAKHSGEGRVGIDVRNISVRTTGDWAHGVYAWQQGSYILREDGRSTRARGAVVVNLIETDRDRADRARPLVATRGDNADAVRAEYTRAAARGHIAVTVEGYDIATGGIVPMGAIVSTPRRPADYVFDPSRPYARNADYDPDDPSSPEFINLRSLIRGIDLRPYSVVYLPVRNPDYDPEDMESRPFIAGEWNPGIAIWNGRYFVAQGAVNQEDVAACSGLSTAEARRNCYVNRIADRAEGNVPTGFEARGVYATHEGQGDIRVRATDNVIRTWGAGAQGIYATHTGRTLTLPSAIEGEPDVVTPGGGSVSINVTGGSIDTRGVDSHGIWARHRGDSGADDGDRVVDPDDIGTGDVSIAVTGADIDTAGDHARGVYGLIQQTRSRTGTDDEDNPTYELVEGTGVGDIDIAVTGGSITTAGIGGAYAVHARHENTGAITVRLTGVDVETKGTAQDVADDSDPPEFPFTCAPRCVEVDRRQDVPAADAAGAEVHGVFAEHRGSAGTVSVTVNGGSVATRGAGAHGVYGHHAGSGDLTVEVASDISTAGERATGVLALHQGSGALAVTMTGGAVRTAGVEAYGIHATRSAAGDISVDVAGGSVAAEGAGSVGVLTRGSGAMTVSVGRGASVAGGYIGIQLSAAEADAAAAPTRTVRVDGAVTANMLRADGMVTDVPSSAIYLPTGGMVSVGASGRVSAASGNAIVSRGAGDLTADVAGTVTGNVLGEGSGDHTVMVRESGTVSGTIRLAASTVTVNGAAGRVWLENGGEVAVGGTGSITGVEGQAIRSDTGHLTAELAGMLTGDVLALGTGRHSVTVAAGGTVTGTVRITTPVGGTQQSELTVDGEVGRVMIDEGGAFTVGPKGRINREGRHDVAVSSLRGAIEITLQESPDEMPGEAADRVKGRILAADGRESVTVWYQSPGSTEPIELGRLGTRDSAPSGAYDLGLEMDESGGVRVVRELAPRARVYEALPSVLLGMTRLTDLRDRMTAPRDAKGVWARVHGSRGKWKAASSTTSELEYYRSSGGFQGGLDATIRDGVFGVSVHHRRGQADISKGGSVDLFGVGGGISGTWRRNDVYVDVQGETTFYETDLSSSLRGDLKKGVRSRSHALGMEVGRRSDHDGIVVVPRFGLAYASASWRGFTDKVDARVSGDGQSLKGRGGVTVEANWNGNPDSRWSGSIDLEHELRDETTVNVSGTDLKSEAEATWLRLGLNGIHVWGDGRYTLSSGVSYAATNRVDSYEVGGEMNLKVRF